MTFDTDVFVLGGGPAGLAAAVACRRRGFTVALADGCLPPIDKACGEGLLPRSLIAAAQLGIEIPERAGFSFRGIRFSGPSHSVSALFPQGNGRGVRRTLLHSLLVDAAAKAGVQMHWGVSVTGIKGHMVQMKPGLMSARWIIGADGGQSMVRRWAGLSKIRHESRRFGFRSHYAIAPWAEEMEIYWNEGCQFYVTPIAADEICVALMSRDSRLRIGDALPRFPTLFSRLRGIRPSTQERGSFAATRRIRRIVCGHIALVGDASGSVDAITGEGLGLAFEEAIALAAAIEAGDLSQYEAEHARITRHPVFTAGFLLTLDRSAWLRDRALQALSARPELFASLLSALVGRVKIAKLVATAATLGWRIAMA